MYQIALYFLVFIVFYTK